MAKLFNAVQTFVTNEDGPTAVEYAVVVALIIVGAIGAVTAFGGALSGWFQGTSTTVGGLPTS